jgi:hypothetical protein
MKTLPFGIMAGSAGATGQGRQLSGACATKIRRCQRCEGPLHPPTIPLTVQRAGRISSGHDQCMTKASKAGCRSAGGLRRKLGEDFLAHLNRSWELHGREILARVMAERPELYFKALVKLTLALHRAIREPTDFDRRRNREEVLRRLEVRIADARTLPEQLKAGHEPGRSTKPW